MQSAERAAAGSDVANVRVGAQSDAHARVAGYEEAHADAPPQMDAIGVLSVQEQEMEAVLTGISELVRTTGDGPAALPVKKTPVTKFVIMTSC